MFCFIGYCADVASVLEWSDVGCELRELDGDKLRCRCNISAGFVTVLTETQPVSPYSYTRSYSLSISGQEIAAVN